MLNKAIILLFTMLFSLSVTAKDTDADLYFIVHFETGPTWDKSLPPQEQLKFREHSQNLNQLRKQKVIVFGARYSDFGVIFIKAESLDKAKSIISADPGVESGIFKFSIEPLNIFYPWKV